LEQHRLAQIAHRLEEREVLHVARADLQEVRGLGDQRKRLGVLHLGDYLEARFRPRLRQQLQPARLEALEVVRAGARLERAAAQGPAITTRSRPPTGTPETSTTVSSRFTSRETSLYGAVTGMQSATPSISRKCPGSIAPLLPVMPMAVRPAPSIACGAKPSS